MMKEYFSMTIDEEGNLLTLPQILPSYKPEIGAMATFILRYPHFDLTETIEVGN